jgi:hypothetical protein
MSLSMYQASIPVFVRGMRVLSHLLEVAATHVQENGLDPSSVLDARLAPDMFTLTAQIQRASDTSKMSGERLSGVKAPAFEDNETTFDALQTRIANTISFLESIAPAQLDDAEKKSIEIKMRKQPVIFSGDTYLLTFGLPNFYFHVAMAHGILRNKGVNVGKADYLGAYQ